MAHSRHPLNFSFSSIHTFGNGVTSSEIDFEWILKSTANWLLLGGAGGAIYGGGLSATPGAFVFKKPGKIKQHFLVWGPRTPAPPVWGRGGPDLGFFYRPWRVGMNAQFGYGAAKTYGQLNIYKQLGWIE